MAKDFFQIGTEGDIYLTIDLWAMLSPRLSQNEGKSSDNQNRHRFKKTNIEEGRNADVD